MKAPRIAWLIFLKALMVMPFIVSCEKAEDPSAIDVSNLKFPHNLKISDQSGGDIQLSWNGANFEDGFEGYNVYGMKFSDEDIEKWAGVGLAIGSPLQLLDDDGKPRAEVKEILALFNFNGEDLESAKKSVDDDGKRKIVFLPIHSQNKKGEPILPTCYP